MDLTRKNSPRTYRMESSMQNVESRYLRGPVGSVHDHCKCGIPTQPPEPKTINSSPKKVPKPPFDRRVVVGGADHSVNRLKRSLSAVPKSPTRITTNVIKNNNKFVKDEGINRLKRSLSAVPKKDVAIEPKSRDLKPKSQVSRTSRRRHSDIFNPNEEDLMIPLRVPTRRLSDVGSISNESSVRGLTVSKNESRKDSKLPLVTIKRSNSKLPSVINKKSNSKLPSVSISKPVAKVLPPLRSFRSLPKPAEVKGPRKLMPTKTIIGVEVVPQKTRPRVIERSKTQIPISATFLSSASSEDKVVTSNGLQESCSPSMEDNTPETDGGYNEKIADLEEVGKLMVESIENQITISSTSCASSSDQEEVITSNGTQESCLQSMEDNTLATDTQFNERIEALEDKTAEEIGKLVVESIENQIPISSTSYDPSSERKVEESCSPSMEDNTPEIDGQNNEKIEDLEDKTAEEVGKLVVESIENEIPISSTSYDPSSDQEEVVNGLQESCSPSMEDNTPETDGIHNEKIEDLEDETVEEVEKLAEESIENQILISSTSYDPSSEEKVITPNGLQESCSPSMKDNTPETDDLHNEKTEDLEDKTTEEVEKLAVETIENQIPISPTSSASSSNQEKLVASNDFQESCAPSMEDNTHETTIDDQHNDNKTSDSDSEETTESQTPISSTSSSSSEEKITTQEIPPSMEEDDTLTKDANRRVEKLVVETKDDSELELRFRRGKVISSHSENTSPRKAEFRQGEELEENESWKFENISLRRLSSDGAIISAEPISRTISVDLKHQEVMEKKDLPELNKLIEETASKLIRTRKAGKVKALVGAFETITTGSTQDESPK